MKRGAPGLLLSALAVAALTGLLYFSTVGTWPWDHDEVSGLVEVGASNLHVTGAPTAQLTRIRRAVPVWFAAQRTALTFLPATEWGSRFLPVCCAVGSVVLMFVVGWKRRGPAFACALAMVMALSEPLIMVGQNNRFYSTAIFLALLTLSRYLADPPGVLWIDLATVAGFTTLAIFTHNLLVVFFCLCFAAAVVAWVSGYGSRHLLMRTGASAAVSVGAYFLYLRFVIAGWASGGLGQASAPVSLAAAAGVPTICLAGLGLLTLVRREERTTDRVFLGLLLIAEGAFIASWPLFLSSWNAWYGFLFLPPLWLLAAFGVSDVGSRMPAWQRGGWYLCVVLLLTPKFASYFRDGSRHDLRRSAAIVAANLHGEQVLANWPSEVQYYLDRSTAVPVTGWWRDDPVPSSACIIVYASNAFEPAIAPAGRSTQVLGEVFTRRFDEQSYVVRIYRVGAIVHDPGGARMH